MKPSRDTRAEGAARNNVGSATPTPPSRSTLKTPNQPGTVPLHVMSRQGTGPNPTIPAPIPSPEAAIPTSPLPQGLVQGLAARMAKPGKGLLVGVMLGALAAGALLAWVLVGR
jgi:hypothetical protein